MKNWFFPTGANDGSIWDLNIKRRDNNNNNNNVANDGGVPVNNEGVNRNNNINLINDNRIANNDLQAAHLALLQVVFRT